MGCLNWAIEDKNCAAHTAQLTPDFKLAWLLRANNGNVFLTLSVTFCAIWRLARFLAVAQ
jgi:hypothetical protein